MSRRLSNLPLWLCLAFGFTCWLAISGLTGLPRHATAPELLVTLPRFAQVAMAAGDRHLAANLAGFRVLVAATERMGKEDYAVQARLQEDIAWLNPAHEDNYYIAAAILPWNGYVDASQHVLKRAGEARPFDWTPLFYYAFNLYHFGRDPAQASRWLLIGSERAKEAQDQWALQNVAARWIEKGYETSNAANQVESMANSAPPGAFRKYLHVRAARLQELSRLQKLTDRYTMRYGTKLAQLEDLVAAGMIESIPRDPLGFGYDLDADGKPILRSMPRGSGK